jgi:hypothetical protein
MVYPRLHPIIVLPPSLLSAHVTLNNVNVTVSVLVTVVIDLFTATLYVSLCIIAWPLWNQPMVGDGTASATHVRFLVWPSQPSCSLISMDTVGLSAADDTDSFLINKLLRNNFSRRPCTQPDGFHKCQPEETVFSLE